jgi:hypothetical protein
MANVPFFLPLQGARVLAVEESMLAMGLEKKRLKPEGCDGIALAYARPRRSKLLERDRWISI